MKNVWLLLYHRLPEPEQDPPPDGGEPVNPNRN